MKLDHVASRPMGIFVIVNEKEGPVFLGYVTLNWLTYRSRCDRLHLIQSNVTKGFNSIFLSDSFNSSFSCSVTTHTIIIFAFARSYRAAFGILVTSLSEMRSNCLATVWSMTSLHPRQRIGGIIYRCTNIRQRTRTNKRTDDVISHDSGFRNCQGNEPKLTFEL